MRNVRNIVYYQLIVLSWLLRSGMASPRIAAAALKSLSPRPVESVLSVSRGSLSPRTPERGAAAAVAGSCSSNNNKLKVDRPKSAERNRFSPFKVDTPNRAKILRDGLPNKDHAVLLGSGGFGTVYKASYRGDQVAAKIVRRKKCSDEAVNAERLAAFLRHSNIVKVLGVEEGAAWSLITMELCGRSLQETLDERSLPPEERLAMWKAIASALQFCHRAGVIHADVKPKNVLIATDGQPKLGDFGSCVLRNESRASPGLHGTPGYAAPEVIRGRRPDEASDIYSLGVLAWQLLFREAPFAGLHTHAILYLTGKGARPRDDHLDDDFNGEYKHLYGRLWSERTEDRPGLSVVLKTLKSLERTTASTLSPNPIYKH